MAIDLLPDWKEWTDKTRLELWQAAALILSVNPHLVKAACRNWPLQSYGPEFPEQTAASYKYLLERAIAAFDDGQLALGENGHVSPMDRMLGRYHNIRVWWVCLSDFCDWAEANEYDVPYQLGQVYPRETELQASQGKCEDSLDSITYTLTVTDAASTYRDDMEGYSDSPLKFSSVKALITKACNKGEIKCMGKGRERHINEESLAFFTQQKQKKLRNAPDGR